MALACECLSDLKLIQLFPTETSLKISYTNKTLTAAIRNLRNKPHLLFVRLPYFLSFACIVVGVVWLLLLPLNEYSRQTYISENALLPGQVHAYFSGSEQNVFRGYKKELEGLLNEGRGEEAQQDVVTPAYVNSSGLRSD